MNSLAYWIVLAIFGVAFLAVLAKLAFDPQFRRDMLAKSAEPDKASIGPFSIQGATVLVLLLSFGGGLVFLAQKLADIPGQSSRPAKTPQSEQVIKEYFSSINQGLAGNSKGFSQAWALLTKPYQQKKSQKYPTYNLPDEYGRLYANSAHHRIVVCTPVAGTEEDGFVVYYVVLKLTEPHYTNPFFDHFSPPTLKQVAHLENILAPEHVTTTLFEALGSHYVMPGDLSMNTFSQRVTRIYLNRLISPRLLTELAAGFKLDKKAPLPDEPIGADRDEYEVYEGNKIRVKKVDSEWRIDNFKISTFCGHRLDM